MDLTSQPTSADTPVIDGPNKVVLSPARDSTAWKLKIATRASALVTPLLTVIALWVQPKRPDLAVAILGIGGPLTALLNSLHSDAVQNVAISASNQAANMGPAPTGKVPPS